MENRKAIIKELKIDEKICPEILDMFEIIGCMSNDYLINMEELLQDDFESPYYENMDIRTSLNLIREFLTRLDIKYLEVFEKSLIDGTFDLHLPEDDLTKRPTGPEASPKPNASISIPIEYTIQDGATIIHEFFHYLNDNNNLDGTREIYTEMISIYFELRYYKFLIKKGYNNLYFYNEVFERINSTCDSAYNLCYTNSILDIYHNTGDINKSNIMFLDKYRDLYKGNVKNMIEFYNDDKFENYIKYFKIDVSYVMGTLLAFMALKIPKLYDIKMKYINDNIDTLSINDVLNILDVNIEEYPIWIDRCVKYLKKAIGVVYEESDMYSGTYGSR